MLILLTAVVGFGMYKHGYFKGFIAAEAAYDPLVAALEKKSKSYNDLTDALNRQVAAQKTQIEAQGRLIKAYKDSQGDS